MPRVDDDELYRINALHRFTKHSRLVLESHSHCEVPAGCGGAVLQWLDPEQGAPLHFEDRGSYAVEGRWLDGVAFNTSSVRAKSGPHVLALQLKQSANPKLQKLEPWLMVHVQRRERGRRTALALGSAATASWRCVTQPPDPSWHAPAFDDARWEPMTASRITAGKLESWMRETFTAWQQEGVVALALPREPQVFVRCRFTLSAVPSP